MATLRNEGLFHAAHSARHHFRFREIVGGVNWGSAAWDPQRNIILANTNRVAAVAELIPASDMAEASPEDRRDGVARRVRSPTGHHPLWACIATGWFRLGLAL